jgi:3-phenylpropionate/cinnamic acid dioxygenase small subunit
MEKIDDILSQGREQKMNIELLQKSTAFVWAESDMLDHNEYQDWLQLWAPEGIYVIPIDPNETDYENTLNYAYDDAHMREKRVARLTGGEAISSAPLARTVRSVSRVRLLSEDNQQVTLRCAQHLREFRKDRFREHTSDVTYELLHKGESFRIQRKIVKLINSTDTLTTVGYIL